MPIASAARRVVESSRFTSSARPAAHRLASAGCAAAATDRNRSLHQTPGEAQQRDRAGVGRREPLPVPLVHREEREAGDDRYREPEVAQELAIAWSDPRSQADAAARIQPRAAERAEHGSHERAPGEAVYAHPGRQHEASEDDAGVVDERREGGREETTSRQQARLHDATHQEEDLAGEDDPREPDRERVLLGVERGVLQRRERSGGEPQDRRDRDRQQAHRADHRREQPIGRRLAALAHLRVERQEGDREGARGEQVVQEVREREGRVVGVGAAAGTDLVGEQRLAHEAERPGEEHAPGEQHGRRGHPGRFRPLAALDALDLGAAGRLHVPHPRRSMRQGVGRASGASRSSSGLSSRQGVPSQVSTTT
jgi:hypothetical protein